MSEIISTKKRADGKFLAEVLLDEKEHLSLHGHTQDIIMFSDKTSFVDTNISQRGKNAATKYFLIPRSLRRNLNFKSKVACQKIEYNTRTLFVYVIDII